MRYLFLLIVLFPVWAAAAPVIDNVTGNFGHGQTAQITGVALGVKATGPPKLWKNFEDRTAGANVVGDDGWTTAGTAVIKYDNSKTRGVSSVNVKTIQDYPAGKVGPLARNVYPAIHGKKMVSFWYLLDKISDATRTTYDGQAQLKIARITPGLEHGAYPMWNYNQMYYNDGSISDKKQGVLSSSSYNIWNPITRLNQWARMTILVNESSMNTANGSWSYHWLQNGNKQNGEKLNITTQTTQYPLPITWGEFGYTLVNAPGMVFHTYWDDIYMDDSWARVEICNASTYNESDLCEMQVPQTWSTSSINFTVNKGSLGTNAFLYVFDDNGVPNVTGVDFTFGAAAPDTTEPVLIDSSPYDAQTNVTKNGTFTDTWDESLSSASVTSGLSFSNCGTVSGLTTSGNVVSGTFSGQSDSQTCTRTYGTAVENLAGINLTSPIARSFITAATVVQDCNDVDDLCVNETECLTAWPSNNWCEGETPACKPEACSVELTCSYEYWGLCKTQLATEAIPGLYWDSRDGGFARTTPVPTDEIGPNLVGNSDMSTWDTRISSGGYAAGYLPTYWITYSTTGVERDSQGVKLTNTAHIIPDYLLVEGKHYRWTQQTYSVTGAWKFWWPGVDDVLNYSPGTHSTEFTMTVQPEHQFYTGVTAGSVGVANHFQLYEVSEYIEPVRKVRLGGVKIKTVSSTP